MKTSPPILLYTLSILLASGVRQGFSSLVCLYDSLQTVDCTWTPMKNATEAQCHLTGSVERTIHFTQYICKTCQLHGVGIRSCQLIFDAFQRIQDVELAMCRTKGILEKTSYKHQLSEQSIGTEQRFMKCSCMIKCQSQRYFCAKNNNFLRQLIPFRYEKVIEQSYSAILRMFTQKCIGAYPKLMAYDLILGIRKDTIRSLTVSDTIRLVVTCLTGENETEVNLQEQMIEPFQKIQLQPPCAVQLENSSMPSYNLTWKLCILSHYLQGWLEYEVQYKRKGAREDPVTLPIVQDQKWLKIEALAPDTEFEAVVRVKTQTESNYNSIWSKWSKPITWKTYSKVSAQAVLPNLHILLPVLVGSLITIFLIIAVTLKTNSQTSKWLRKLLKIYLPDPSSFLPSLTAVHGDIQQWLSSPLSVASFHITAASPDVSALEIIQKGDQEPCFLLPKEYLSPMDTAETSGHSSSSCFTNRGYFFFHHVDSLEIEPCKVYFTYDPFAQDSSGSEDENSCPYKALHAADDNLPLPSYGIMGSEDVSSFLPETTQPIQKARVCSEVMPSTEGFQKAPAVEHEEGKEGSEVIIRSPESPHQSVMVFSEVPEQSINNTNNTEAIGNTASHTSSVENNRSPSLPSAILNPGQPSDLCRTVSWCHIFSDEAYVSLRDVQSHRMHHSV